MSTATSTANVNLKPNVQHLSSSSNNNRVAVVVVVQPQQKSPPIIVLVPLILMVFVTALLLDKLETSEIISIQEEPLKNVPNATAVSAELVECTVTSNRSLQDVLQLRNNAR
jgi:hypothetical protein